MNKRGQIYVLVALILALVLYTLMTRTNIIYEHEIIDDFETLSRNYDIEASKFINSLLSEDSKDVKGEFQKFTDKFKDFAKSQNPDFGLIFVFAYEETVYIGNYLKYPIFISNHGWLMNCIEGGTSSAQGSEGIGVTFSQDTKFCIEEIPLVNSLDITIGSTLYKIDVSENRPEIIIVSREEKGDQRKVYTEEEFVGGGGEAVSGSEYCAQYTNLDFCTGTRNEQFRCDIFNGFKDACKYDENCCWNEGICEQGRCQE